MKEKLLRIVQNKYVTYIFMIFAYGGVVNLGVFGIFPAIPFIIFLAMGLVSKDNPNRRIVLIFFAICAPLYILKKYQTPIYFPASGKVIVTRVPLCVTEYYNTTLPRAILSTEPPKEGNVCVQFPSTDDHTLKGSWPAGKKFTIQETEVSHADLGERFVIKVQTEYGPLRVSVSDMDKEFVWPDGTFIKQEDIFQPLLFYPSLLMYYPVVVPIFFSSPKILLGRLFYKDPGPTSAKIDLSLPAPAIVSQPMPSKGHPAGPSAEPVRTPIVYDTTHDSSKKGLKINFTLMEVLLGGCKGNIKFNKESYNLNVSDKNSKPYIESFDGEIEVAVDNAGNTNFPKLIQVAPTEKHSRADMNVFPFNWHSEIEKSQIIIGENYKDEKERKGGTLEKGVYKLNYHINMNTKENLIIHIQGDVSELLTVMNNARKYTYNLSCIGKTPQELEMLKTSIDTRNEEIKKKLFDK